MLASYVWRDLVRNPRRTLASLVGVTLGVAFFSGVLFFADGSAASMTQRAIAPLAIDMQRVLTTPLGSGLRFRETVAGPGTLRAGQAARVRLTVRNTGNVPVAEVVVGDEPPPPLSYLRGTTRVDGRRLSDPPVGSPLAQGVARVGLNLGTVRPDQTVTVTYRARASRPVQRHELKPGGTVSSRENVVPTRANAPTQLSLPGLAARVGRLPGVAAADGLAFVDLPPGSVGAGGTVLHDTVRLFGFDRRYARHYPSVRLVSGSFRPGSALVSVEAARALADGRDGPVHVRLPGRPRPLTLPVAGTTDLSRARPLFYSRKSTDLEDFLYLPHSVVVDPATFRRAVVPAYRAATAARGRSVKSLPFAELDVLVDRSRLQSDPGAALAQTRAVARKVRRTAPGQDYLIDNISNTLHVARDDAAVAKRMFLFLGLPGALLAAFLAAYAGSVLAAAERRERAVLRIRGAHRSHLLRMLLYRTVVLAGTGAALGTALGLASVTAILGRETLFRASPGELAVSALVSVGAGLVATAAALYVPGRRSLAREINQERSELSLAPAPAWQRRGVDVALLVVALAAEVVALRSGAFDAPPGSVYAGRAVSLPSYLLLAPVVVWLAGLLLVVRLVESLATRTPVHGLHGPHGLPGFGGSTWGTLARSLRRRHRALAGGTLAVGLVAAFGTSLAVFTATYQEAKAADTRFVVGSDMHVTPSVLARRSHPPGLARRIARVRGVAAATPVVYEPENVVVTGPYTEDRQDMAAIDPRGFRRVAALADEKFVGMSASTAMASLGSHRRGLLVSTAAADEFQVEVGDRVEVLLARGTRRQTVEAMRVVGVFRDFPGFADGVDVVANLHFSLAATGGRDADLFLVRTTDHTDEGLARTEAALRAGPGERIPFVIESTATALDRDQSSLTALNVRGLLDLDSFYTLLMAAAGIGIFVFGLLLARRREYVTLRALGMPAGEVRLVVLGESAVVTTAGLAGGVLVGTGVGALLVYVLRPLFVLEPRTTVPPGDLVLLVGLALAATVACALGATALVRRLRPTEVLRET